MDSEAVIHLGADLLSKQSGVSRDLILGALLERNRLGETPADAGVALPHLLLNDVDDFYLVAARSTKGIEFPGAAQPIHAVFLLLGDRGNPTRHLRFLAEIARRAEDSEFIPKWIESADVYTLSELLLRPKDVD